MYMSHWKVKNVLEKSNRFKSCIIEVSQRRRKETNVLALLEAGKDEIFLMLQLIKRINFDIRSKLSE